MPNQARQAPIVHDDDRKHATGGAGFVHQFVIGPAVQTATMEYRNAERPSAAGWFAWVTLVIAVLGSPTCSARGEDCAFRCPDAVCGEGLHCTAEGWCVRDGSDAICADAEATGGEGGNVTSAGYGGFQAGATSGSGAPGAGDAGVGTHSATGGDGNSSGDGGDATRAGAAGSLFEGGAGGDASVCRDAVLRVSLQLPEDREVFCVGDPTPMELVVEGGVPPYEWSLSESPEFTLVTQVGAEVELAVEEPLAVREYMVTAHVADACRNDVSASFPIVVREPPELASTEIPRGCVDRLYRTALVPLPGSAVTNWRSSDLPPGLSMDSHTGVIDGTLELDGEFGFNVVLSNGCDSPAERVNLSVYDKFYCPVRSTFRSGALPSPCLGEPYTAELQSDVVGTLRGVNVPPDTQLEPHADGLGLTIVGAPNVDDSLLIELHSDQEHTVIGFPMEPRRSCWFGFIDDDEGEALRFFDAHRHSDVSESRNATRSPVESFAFSPSGRFVAYATSELHELFVVDLSSWHERSVPLDGEVLEYAWSASDVLAVAFQGETSPQLGGVSVGEFDWQGGSELVPFAPTPAPVRSALTWIGEDFVAFLSEPSNSTGLAVNVAHRAPGADYFSTPAPAAPIYVAPALQPTEDGLFVVDWRPSDTGDGPAARLDFVLPTPSQLASPAVFSHHSEEIVSPAGNYTGRIFERAFGAFLPAERTLDAAEPALQRQPCAKILAWTRDGRQVACVSGPEGEEGELRMFGLSAGDESGRFVDAPSGFSVSSLTSARRAFSRSGAWFAYPTSEGLAMADLREEQVKFLTLRDAHDVADVEFSPHDRVVLVQRAGTADVQVASLEVEEPYLGSLEPAAADRCIEEFVRAPGAWCGRDRAAAGFAWSATPSVVAFRNAAGELVVLDLSSIARGKFEEVLRRPSRAFSFQPEIRNQERIADADQLFHHTDQGQNRR